VGAEAEDTTVIDSIKAVFCYGVLVFEHDIRQFNGLAMINAELSHMTSEF